MSNTTARRAWRCAALAGLAAARSPARAQSAWPSRPVKIIAPVQPGGGVDLVARTVAERLARAMSASFVVENMAGGGGVIASQAVARAAPDGHTLMVGYVGTHGTNPATRKIPPFVGPLRDRNASRFTLDLLGGVTAGIDVTIAATRSCTAAGP